MSHTVKINIEFKDLNILALACQRLNIKYDYNNIGELYDGTKIQGFIVNLPGWIYPVIIKDAIAYYDNYNNNFAWGDLKELNKLKMYYGIEKTKAMAKKCGYRVCEIKNGNKLQLKIYC